MTIESLTTKDKKWIKDITWNVRLLYLGIVAQVVILLVVKQYSDSILNSVNSAQYIPQADHVTAAFQVLRIVSVLYALLIVIYSLAWIKTQRGDQKIFQKLMQ